MKHRFRGEATTQAEAVDTAYHAAITPNFPAVGPSLVVDGGEDSDDLLIYPVAVWSTAVSHGAFKIVIEPNLEITLSKPPRKRPTRADSLDRK
jgi:hypothetical protein